MVEAEAAGAPEPDAMAMGAEAAGAPEADAATAEADAAAADAEAATACSRVLPISAAATACSRVLAPEAGAVDAGARTRDESAQIAASAAPVPHVQSGRKATVCALALADPAPSVISRSVRRSARPTSADMGAFARGVATGVADVGGVASGREGVDDVGGVASGCEGVDDTGGLSSGREGVDDVGGVASGGARGREAGDRPRSEPATARQPQGRRRGGDSSCCHENRRFGPGRTSAVARRFVRDSARPAGECPTHGPLMLAPQTPVNPDRGNPSACGRCARGRTRCARECAEGSSPLTAAASRTIARWASRARRPATRRCRGSAYTARGTARHRPVFERCTLALRRRAAERGVTPP